MIESTAVDLFAGAGGATQGLVDAGFTVLGAVENDDDAAASYRANHPLTQLWATDIRKVSARAMRKDLGLVRGELSILKACPPCQGFSSLATGRGVLDEVRNDLVGVTLRFVREFMPRSVLVENVPGLAKDHRAAALLEGLKELGYVAATYTVDAQRFGVPQRRKRFIIIALRGRRRKALLPSLPQLIGDETVKLATVRTAFAELNEKLTEDDGLHRPRPTSALVQERIAAIPVGGNRFDLPPDLQLDCHKRLDVTSRRATASYGRMKWDEVSPTMTTRCTTPACGSFVHPEESRGITLREAATLQTFPHDYKFTGSYGSVERQIGNAVPVRMAAHLGRAIARLI